jgi:PAS domain S-box-containing protein
MLASLPGSDLKNIHIHDSLLNAVLVFVASGVAVGTFISFFFVTTHRALSLGLGVTTLLVVVVVHRLVQHRGSYGASIVLTLLLWALVSGLVVVRGGIYGPTFGGYIVVIVIAVTLLGTRWGGIFALMSTLIGAVHSYLAYAGLIAYEPVEPMVVWATYLLFFIIVIGVVGLAYHYVQLALKQAQDHEQHLRETNHSLQASNDLLTATLSSIDEAVFVLEGTERIIRTCNAAAEQITGYGAEELIGQPISILHTDPESYNQFVQKRAEHLVNSRSYQTPYLMRRCGGERRHVVVTIAPLQQSNSLMVGEVSIIRDVTEDHVKSEKLRESEANYRDLFNTMQEALIVHRMIYDEDGTAIDYEYLEVNPAFERLTGFNRDVVVGKTARTVLPSIAPDVIAGYDRVVKTGEVLYKEQELVPDLNRYFSITAFRPSPGQFVTTFHDVTDRVQAQAALAHSEKMFRTMTESMLAATLILQDGQVIYSNPAAQRFTGYTSAQIQEIPASMLVHSDSLGQAKSAFASLTAGEQSQIRIKIKANTSNQNERWFDCSACMLQYEGAPAILVIAFDITKLIQAQKALEEERALLSQRVQERTAELTQANLVLAQTARHKDEFLASMSHELRTPLNAILGIAEAMNEDVYGPLNEVQKTKLRNIEVSGRHLLELINDVLDMAKIEAGKLTIDLDRVDVKATCEASLQIIRQAAMKKRLTMKTEIDPHVTFIQADGRRLKQMLINLLSNAVKFTPEDGVVGLEVTQAEREGALYLTVWDTGIGIAPEHQERMFQPFIQIDSRLSRQYNGSGLGLALVHKMAQLHGGTISLESTPGEGSRFTIKLPLPAEAEAVAITHPLPPAHKTALPWRSALLLEDTVSAAEQMTRYLNELGIEAVHHHQATGAVERVQSVKPDIIFLDILLPDGDGWEVLAQLKKTPQTSSIPVVVTSVVDRRVYAMQQKAVGYLLKPFERSELYNVLYRIAHGSGAESANESGNAAENHHARPRSLQILLVEDNELTAETFAEYLEDKGYNVSIAHNGLEAVNRTQIEEFDLILMDVQMPEMDGLEATQQIRAGGLCRETPILALTALSMPGDEERCLQAGATAYLSKPVRLQQLTAYVQKLTQGKEKDKERSDTLIDLF